MITTVYIVSGPCGVGKSTVAQALARSVARAALIQGDAIMDLVQEGHGLSWDQQLALAWENIATLTRNFVRRDLNVVIDFVVEEEWAWFCSQLADLPVQIKYVVLVASEDTLRERLAQRGDTYLVERSLFLLKQLTSAAGNAGRIYDTTSRQPGEIVADLLALPQFAGATSRTVQRASPSS